MGAIIYRGLAFDKLSKALKYLIWLGFFSTAWPALCFGVVQNSLVDTGYSKESEAEAREFARSALASQIFVQVQNESVVFTNKKGENFFTGSTQSHTDLPLMAVQLSCKKRHKIGHECTATMDTSKAIGLYEQQLTRLQKQINSQYAQLSQLPAAQHHAVVSQVLLDYEQYEKYFTILTFLEGKVSQGFPLTPGKADLHQRLRQLEEQVQSLELAAKLLSKPIKQKNIYVRPPMLDGSHTVTPFGKAMADRIEKYLVIANEPKSADYTLTGRYQLNKSGLLLTYRLQNQQGKILSSQTLELAPDSYKQYRVKPLDIDFDHLLTSGYAQSGALRVDVATNKGKHGLAFSSDDSLAVLVKLNKPGHLYIVGHSKNQQSELSYLLGAHDNAYDNPEFPDNNRFIKYIGPDQANQWITLIDGVGPCPPYGEESLQVMASNDRASLEQTMPNTLWDDELGYFVVSHERKQAVLATRGVKPKASKTKKIETSEAVMVFSTHKGKSEKDCSG